MKKPQAQAFLLMLAAIMVFTKVTLRDSTLWILKFNFCVRGHAKCPSIKSDFSAFRKEAFTPIWL